MTDVETHEELPWLNKEYIVKILNHISNNELLNIKSFAKSKATLKGENFISLLHILNVSYTLKSKENELVDLNVIVKSLEDNEVISQLEDDDFNVFLRESQFYNVIMEQGEQLLHGIGDNTKFGPRAIYIDDRVIILENLKVKGYEMANVKQGLNFEQCRVVAEKLARLHAVSMVLFKKNPDVFRHHLPGNVSEHPSPLHELYTNGINSAIECCRNNEELKQFVPTLQKFGEKIIAKMINVYSRSQVDRFHVLNHGDVWVNNLMYKDQYAELLFIDFQEGFYGSPGIDWNYFIYSSWQPEVFENNLDKLVDVYHGVLHDILTRLNYQQRLPTKEDVMKEILNKAFHGLATATCILPILINENEDLTDPMNFLLNTPEAIENRRIIFSNPKYGERLKAFLTFFKQKGVLE